MPNFPAATTAMAIAEGSGADPHAQRCAGLTVGESPQLYMGLPGYLDGGGGPGPGETPPPANPLRIVHRVLRGRYGIAACAALVCAAVGGLAGYMAKKPLYVSIGMIQMIANRPSVLYADEDDSRLRLFDAHLLTEISYLQGRTVLERALAKIGTSQLPRASDAEGLVALQQALSVERKGALIVLSSKHTQPTTAAAIATAVVDAYEESHVDESRRRDSVRERQLSDRERELLQSLQGVDSQLLEVGQEYGLNSIATAHVHKIAQIEDVDTRISELATTVAAREASGPRNDVDTGDVEIKRLIVLDHATADLLFARTQRATELAVLKSKHAAGHYEILEVQEALRVLDEAIEDRRLQLTTLGATGALNKAGESETEESLDQLKALMDRLIARREELRSEARTLNDKLIRLGFLDEEREQTRKLLDATRRALDEVRVESQNALPGTMIVQARGSVPTGPAEDKRKAFAMAGVGLGGTGGLAMIALLGIVFRRYRYSDELDGLESQGPLVGVLPEAASFPEAAFTLCVHRMRTQLQILARGDTAARVVAVTGAARGSGASTVALELARSYAEAQRRTMLVDADLVEEAVTRRLGLAEQPGLRQALSHDEAPAAIASSSSGYLSIMPVGGGISVRDESLAWEPLVRLLSQLRQHHDVIVVDAGCFDDRIAARLAVAIADQVALVTRPGVSATLLKRVAEEVDGIAPGRLRFVFNAAARNDPSLSRLRDRAAGDRSSEPSRDERQRFVEQGAEDGGQA